MRKQAQELKAGESFFFQGGWQLAVGGHAVVYEVIKQPDGLSPSGLQPGLWARVLLSSYRRRKSAIPSLYRNSRYLFREFDGDALSDSIAGIRKSPCARGKMDSKRSLCSDSAPLLGGRYSHRVYAQDQLLEMLQVGHCSYLSLTALLSQQMGDKASYSRWELEVQLKTLWDYFGSNRERLAQDEQARHLLREGLAQLGRDVIRRKKRAGNRI